MFKEKISAIEGGGQIIILPEMFTTGFSMNPSRLAEKPDGATVSWMKEMAIQKKSIIAGSIIIEEGKESKAYYNRLIWMQPNGEYGIYDKRHLFAYAGEDRQYTPGNQRVIFSVNGWRILPQICYDLRFPVWSRQQIGREDESIKPEYDVIVYVANWPQKRKHAWRTLLMARAIENQAYVVGINRTGIDGNDIIYSGNSMVVDPLGEIIFEEEGLDIIKTVDLSKKHLQDCRNKFPFLRDSDSFQLFKD
jgi:predicted amidohydrolase